MKNIAEILKDAPKGLKLYSPVFGEAEFVEVSKKRGVWNIKVKDINGCIHYFDECGRYSNIGDCVLFPSSEHRDWKDWKKVLIPQCVGSVIVLFDYDSDYEWIVTKKGMFAMNMNEDKTYLHSFNEMCYDDLRFATPKETEVFFERLNKLGYKFEDGEVVKKEKEWSIFDAKDGDIIHDEETDAFFIFKKLERGQIFRHLALIDGVIHDNPDIIYDYLYSLERYRLATTEEKESFLINIGVEGYYWNWVNKKLWKKEVEKQFTINDLKPFDKVIGRMTSALDGEWCIGLYSHYNEKYKAFITTSGMYNQCVPYNEETAHLLGTTKNYDGSYKTW